jgi:hypothetical protein
MRKAVCSVVLSFTAVCFLCSCTSGKDDGNKKQTDTYQLEVEDSESYLAITGDGMIFEVDEDTKEAALTSYYDVDQEEFLVPDEISYNGKVYPVTSVGESAFESDPVLTTVTLGSNVTTLDTDAFYSCPELTSITLDDSLTTIEEYGIGGCDLLTELTLPDSLETVGDYAFTELTGLEEVTIPAGITSWGQEVFSECSALKKVTIADGLQTLGAGVFTNCQALEEVIFEGSISTINQEAFWGCSALTDLTLPDGLTSIEDNAFYDTSIKSLRLPESVTDVTVTSFDSMDKLKTLEVPESKKAAYEEIAEDLGINLKTY